MNNTFDLIVIGTGMELDCAHECCSAGWNVAIIDSLPFGVTCALRSCYPKKFCRGGKGNQFNSKA